MRKKNLASARLPKTMAQNRQPSGGVGHLEQIRRNTQVSGCVILFLMCVFLFWLQPVAIVQPVARQISNIIDLFHAMRSCIPWLQTIKIVSIVLVPARNIQTRTLFAHATNRSQLRRCSAWYFASPPPSFPHKRRLNFDAFAFSKAQEGRKQWKRGLGVSRQDRVERSA